MLYSDNLDRCLRLRAGRDHQNATESGSEPLHNSTDFKLDRVRENSINSTAWTIALHFGQAGES